MDAIEAILTRTSWARLVEPAPEGKELDTICQAALRAPDHGHLRPWRFMLVRGGAREQLGELFVEAVAPEEPEKVEKLKNAPQRAPLVIVAVTRFQEHPKVPPVEQISSTAAAVQNMSLAAHALGYATIWRTGEVAFHEQVKEKLGLQRDDEIVGYLYLGTPTVRERQIPELATEDFFTDWSG